MKSFVYLVQARNYLPMFEELVTEHSDCIVLFWRPRPTDRRVFDAKHANWSGEIHLYPNGRMERPGIDRGMATIEGSQIVLKWDRWPNDTLILDDTVQEYVSADGRFRMKERRSHLDGMPQQIAWSSFELPGSTWNTGRNRLLSEAMQRTPYRYYIFMDDDLSLSHSSDTDSVSSFRRFERFLLDVQPAIGYCSGGWHSRLDSPNEYSALCAFDANFNAFHRDTLQVLLPYYEGFDVLSWWWSQEMLYGITAMVYPGAAVQANRIEYTNHLHAKYPRRGIKDLVHPYEFVKESLLAPYREAFERLKPLENRGIEYPLSKTSNYSRQWSQLASVFDLEHIYWRDKRAFWHSLNGGWLDEQFAA